MSSILDETLVRPAAEETPFAYGERTVLQMQSQPFELPHDESGTLIAPSAAPRPESRLTLVAPEDPIARLERKLDLALVQIERLQQRIESLDLTLVRVLSR